MTLTWQLIVLYVFETRSSRKTKKIRLNSMFERNTIQKIYGSIFDIQINEWKKLYYD